MGKINAIVEARMGSTRLPGKTFFPLAGKTVLELLVERLRISKRIDDIIVAMPTNPEDDVIEEYCLKHNIKYFRGSSEDVLGRVYSAAEKFDTDIVVEVTGDCPLLDPWLIDECIDVYMKSDCDYLSNFIEQSYPPGIDVQIFSFKVLEDMERMAKDEKYREHVSLYVLKHPEKYKLKNIQAPQKMHYPDWHIELDEEKDYMLIKKIYETLYPVNSQFTSMDVLQLLKDNPHWLKINEGINRTWENARKEEII